MNCTSTYALPGGHKGWGTTVICQLRDGHPGCHIKTFLTADTVTWPNTTAHRLYPSFSVGGYETDGKVSCAKVEGYSDDGTTPVLLTKEELKVIAYYLTASTEDYDQQVIEKIDAALKKLL